MADREQIRRDEIDLADLRRRVDNDYWDDISRDEWHAVLSQLEQAELRKEQDAEAIARLQVRVERAERELKTQGHANVRLARERDELRRALDARGPRMSL